MATVIYHPKGSMCAACIHRDAGCSQFFFDHMKVCRQYSNKNDPTIFKVVICNQFEKADPEDKNLISDCGCIRFEGDHGNTVFLCDKCSKLSCHTKSQDVKKCPNCKREIKGHPNKKFCSSKGPGNCKDAYHNAVNPRGYGESSDCFDDDDQSWDAHKDHGF